MKALSLYQPWASLVMLGEKEYETRSWPIRHRGPLAIHATKTLDESSRWTCWEEPFREVLHNAGLVDFDTFRDLEPESDERYTGLPLGALLGVVTVLDCVVTSIIATSLSIREITFGNYAPGRYAIRLKVDRVFPTPVPCRGHQRIWTVDDALIPPISMPV